MMAPLKEIKRRLTGDMASGIWKKERKNWEVISQ